MEIRTFATALVLIVALNSAAPAGKAGKTITVEGLNQIGDAALIQWALDNVKKNGTVELVGTFALYGTELFVRNNHVTIRGRAIDNDNDGKVNEDWADGEDNDNDGLVDEDDWDAVLVGLTDLGTGLPLPDPTGALFNRGIAVNGLHNVHVTDLKFTGLRRGVAFSDHIGSARLRV